VGRFKERHHDQYLRQLLTLLDDARQFDAYTQQNNGQWHVQSGSALTGDDAKSDPYQVSHSAWHALTVAVDHLQCLRSSILAAQIATHASTVIHTHAQASLVRGVFENAARVVWLLGPANRLQRLTRRLSLQAGEVKHDARLRKLVNTPGTHTTEEQFQRLTNIIVAAGATPDEARKAVKARPSYESIVQEAGRTHGMGADVAELIWKACSSLAHGDSPGTLALLDRRVGVSVPSLPGLGDDSIPAWGRKLTVVCPACGVVTHRYRTMHYDGVNVYRPQAGPDPARVVGSGEPEPEAEVAWIALTSNGSGSL
jgi:hypothetical protein